MEQVDNWQSENFDGEFEVEVIDLNLTENEKLKLLLMHPNLRGIFEIDSYHEAQLLFVDSLILNHKKELAEMELLKLRNDKKIDEKFAIELCWINAKLNNELDKEDFLLVFQQSKKKNSVLDELFLIEILSTYSEVYFFGSNEMLFSASLDLCLTKLAKVKYEKLNNKRGHLLYLKSRESISQANDNTISLKILDKARNEFVISGDEQMLQVIDWHLSTINKAELKIITLDSLSNFKAKDNVLRIVSSDIGFFLMDSDPTAATEYLEYSVDLYEESGCNFRKNFILNYLGMTYMNLGDQLIAESYFQKSNLGQSCAAEIDRYIEFINIRFQSEFYEKLTDDYSLDYGMKMLVKERKLGIEKMSNEPIHLNDYLVENTLAILNLYEDQIIKTDSSIFQILQIFEDTKSRDLLSKRLKDKKTLEFENNPRKLELLREVNDFKDTSGFENPVYKELFEIYAKEYLEYEPEVIEVESFESSEYLLKKLEKVNEKLILNFLANDNRFLAYAYSNNVLQTFEFNGDKLISLSNELDSLLQYNINFESVAQKLKSELLNNIPLDKSKDLVIIPDGKLTGLPLEYLFKDFKSVNVEHSLINYLDRQSLTIGRNNITSFSYTDSTTLADNSIHTHLELNHGFQETQEINQLLNSNTTSKTNQYFTGPNFTSTNFEKHLSSDLYHISAHAATNLDNRLDNYIVIRDEEGKSKKLYSYEIEAMNVAPKVVILSACDTGIGAFKNGKGTYSISRAFMQNGTQTIIKTLWKVDDSSTKDFMVDLYTNWTTGISLGQALKQTRLKFELDSSYTIKEWAGFVLEGNPEVYIN